LQVAGTLTASRGGCDENDACNGTLVAAFGGNNHKGAIDIASACNAKGGTGRSDFETETSIAEIAPTIDASCGRLQGASGQDLNHGHSHLIATAFDCKASGRGGFGVGEIAPTLRAMGHANSHANAGGQVAVMVSSVSLRGRDGGATAEIGGDLMPALRTGGGGGDKPHVLAPDYSCLDGTVAHTLRGEGFDASEDGTGRGTPIVPMPAASRVRRLTPRECERLQGFIDDYTAITYRGRPAADGPRYGVIGNSMPVPVMRWLGRRIAMVDRIVSRGAA
jgi:DNA (cytosine-5)-methyltransferase 1